MKELKRKEKIWLGIAVATLVSVPIGTLATALTALKGMYFLMGVSIAVSVHGFYGVTPYFLRYGEARLRRRLFCLVTEEGIREANELSLRTGFKPEAVEKRLSVLKEKQLLPKIKAE